MPAQRRPETRRLVSAVILAAGESTRMGMSKQLLKLGDLTLLERVLHVLKCSKVDETIVVLGHERNAIRKRIDLSGMRVIVNTRFKQGMSSSLKLGLAAVSSRSAGALIVLADQPFLSSLLINALIEKFQHCDCVAVVPLYEGVQGNPVLLGRSLFGEVASLSGDFGAKAILKRHRGQLVEYRLRRQRPLIDIDTNVDLIKARRLLRSGPGQSRKRPSTYENPGSK